MHSAEGAEGTLREQRQDHEREDREAKYREHLLAADPLDESADGFLFAEEEHGYGHDTAG